MTKLFKNLILFLILPLITQEALCYTLTPAELNKTLIRKINLETKKLVGDVEYKTNIVSGLPKVNIVTNDTNKPKVEISNWNNFVPMGYKRVVVRDNSNNIVQVFNINVQTLIYQNVLVASDTIPYGSEINAANTTIEKKEVSKFFGKTVNQLTDDMVSSKNIQRGSIILKTSTKKKALVSKNSDIDIVFLSNSGLKITLQGKALKEGALGDVVLVRSDKYNKTYSAIVESARKVTVRI